MTPPIIDAVTGILRHQGEIFLIRRQFRLASFPGYYAFPGGKVDLADAEPVLEPSACFNLDSRLFRALMRELEEELGFDWSVEQERRRVDHCSLIGTIETPPFAPLRFNTRFFLLELKTRPRFRLDAREVESGGWAMPQQWLERYELGELLLAPPTLAALRSIAAGSSEIAFRSYLSEGPLTMFETQRGVRQFPVLSDTLPPAQHTNCFLLGDEDARRVLVDPSPNSLEELARLQAAAGTIGFHEILLTHHHRDHCQYADALARAAKVPIAMSADTQARIRTRTPAFFDGLEVKTYSDGDVVTRWLGSPVRIVAVPGHDEGQLALMPDNRGWCIVGDLIQGIGTVVIAQPEGDMRKYFASLERIIAAAPKAIYPSHGNALGGVTYLEQTLSHRRLREAQIKQLSEAGRSIDEILGEVYKGLDSYLLPLARMNIQSHLAKLAAEVA